MTTVSTKQAQIAKLAREDQQRCLLSLNHHIDVPWLLEAFDRTRKDAAPGVDGVTAADYAQDIGPKLEQLINAAKSGRYFAPPGRRVHIAKGANETRPISIGAFEDKVLQRAVQMLLEPIYEQDFLSCSFGFRPGLCAHDGLEALWSLIGKEGCWIVEVDLRKYFDTLQRKHLRTFLDQRVRDGVVRRLIDKWLKAGIWEKGAVSYPEAGTPQGGVLSPLLSNVYLHEVLDSWFEQVVKPHLRGKAFLVRYADDFVIGCEHRDDAERVNAVLPKRFARFGLAVNESKSRMVDFRSPQQVGDTGKGRTFDFLGFTHYWGRSRRGNATVKRRTAKDRLSRSLKSVTDWLSDNRHRALGVQSETLHRKVSGHYNYYGITGNGRQLHRFRRAVERIWKRQLDRRTRGDPSTWEQFTSRVLARHPLPTPKIIWSIKRLADRRAGKETLPCFLPAFT